MYIDIDRVAFYIPILHWPIYWYALAYIVGVIITKHVAIFSSKVLKNGISHIHIERFCNIGILAIIVGGRLGYVLLYQFSFYAHNPSEILKIYRGGMSFYGALLALAISAIIFCRKNEISFWSLTDVLVIGAPFGLFLGRIANFINQELPGYPYDGVFSVRFADDVLRHPSQLYEAFAEGIVLGTVLWLCLLLKRDRLSKSFLSSLFIMLYGCARFICEFFRMPDESSFNRWLYSIAKIDNCNQMLAVMMFVIGFVLLLKVRSDHAYT